MSIVPIGQNTRRLPQAGRIRIGIRDKSRQGRRAINTFRLTSQEESYLGAVAHVYGGQVQPWHDPKSPDRWEVITETNKLNVVLPPDPLSEWYELWSGARGIVRRCDGERCDLATSGPEGADREVVPCVCARKGVLECKYRLRLNVILPEVQTISTWRLDTGSIYARDEIPGVVEVIEVAQGRGLHNAVLRLEQRTSPGHRFNVPVLDAGVSIEALRAGDSRVAALPEPAEPPALPSGDDLVIDAEVVEDGPITIDPITGPQPVNPVLAKAWVDSLSGHQRSKALIRARDLALQLGEPVPVKADDISPLIAEHLMKESHDDNH